MLPDEAGGWGGPAPAVRYDTQTIFQYIDGHGVVYLAYGMIACHARRYAGPAGEGELVADVFEMASPADAYGVFTHSREGDPADVGQDGSYGYGTLSFWKGRYFVSVLAEQESERARTAVLALGRAVAAAIPQNGERPALVSLAHRVALIGEPFQTFFNPSSIKTSLRVMGFGQIEDLEPEEMNARYFRGRKDQLRVGSLAHVMNARV